VKPICDIDNIVKSSSKQQDKSPAAAEMGDRGHNRHGLKVRSDDTRYLLKITNGLV